ncbi:MAG: extracellular solute-binding protein [Chloroflexi bacterium]|nr:extracellular solute-binding protein [Chloroflexota bacterium]
MERKRMSRRVFLQLAGTGLVGSLVVACAPAATEAPKQEAAAAEQAAPAAEEGGKEFVMWGLQYDPHVERYNALAAAFEKKTGYKANIQPQAWPLETKLLAALTAGTQPDVVCVMGIVSVPLFMQKAVIEMDDVVYDAAGVNPQEFFYPEAIQAYTWEGHYMGVPLESNQVSQAVATRYDYLDEAGDEAKALWPGLNVKAEPAGFDSYETMWALAEMLQKQEGGTVTRWGMSSQGWDLGQFFSLMYDLGKFFWDSTNEQFVIDSEEGVRAMEYLVETPVKKGIETQLDDHHMNALFAGKVAVAKGNTSMAPEGAKLTLADGSPMKVEQVMSPSAVKGQEPKFVGEGGWGFEIPTRAKNMDIAVEFCQWMATREGQVIYAQIYGGVVPSTSVVLDDPIYQGDDIIKLSKRRAIASLKNTVYYGNEWGLNRTGSDVPFTEVRQGVKTAAEACKSLQEIFTVNYEQWKESMKG